MNLSLDKSFAEVAFNLPIKEVFTYKIPPEFLGKVQVGMRVFVPFGKRRITGYVVKLASSWDKKFKLRLKSKKTGRIIDLNFSFKRNFIPFKEEQERKDLC